MYGPSINRLDVLIMDEYNKESPIWSREGTQGNVWRLGKVKLNGITNQYSVSVLEKSTDHSDAIVFI